MNPLARLLGELAAGGFRLYAEGDFLDVEPGSCLTPELETAVREHKANVLELVRVHGPNLLALFTDAPTWPPARGRSGPADYVLGLVGGSVRTADGREGLLRLAEYDTRTGRVRCRVDFPKGWALVDPEDLLPALAEQRRPA